MTRFHSTGAILILALVLCCSMAAQAELRLNTVTEGALPAATLDVAATADGTRILALTATGVTVLEASTVAKTAFIPAKGFDRISLLGANNLFLLTNTATGASRVVRLADIYDLVLRDRPALGSPVAPVTLVVFSDFECPSCAQTEPYLDGLLKEYAGDLRVVYKSYPLKNHPHAVYAAKAALAATLQGRFEAMRSMLYENSQSLSVERIDAIARQTGLDMDRYRKDMKRDVLAELVEKDRAEGERVGVKGVPTLFLDGMLVEVQTLEQLKELIESRIDSASGN